MSNYLVDGADLTSVANAIRTKGGTSADLAFPSGFVSAVQAIPTGGGGVSINDINSCRRSGFATVRDDFFSGVVTFAGVNLFPYICAGANKITEVHGPDITTLLQINAGGSNGSDQCHFIDCTALTVVDFPKLTKIGAYMFQRCSGLTSVFFPAVTSWAIDSLSNCSNLETAVFPSVTGTIDRVIRTCVKLSAVDIGNPQTISGNTFNGDSALKTLIIRRTSSNTSLSNINAFGNTPFASGGSGGTLYVPNDLISSYEAATNWSTILGYANNQIKSIESTHTDPNAPIDLTLYYADGTPIT